MNSNLHINRLISIVACITLVFGLLVMPVDKVQAEGTVSLDTLGAAYTQDFNTLAITGTTNTNLPPGWFLYETGTSSLNNGSYGAGTGSNNAGDTYSFGAAGNIERAFGGLLSGTLNPTIGAQFTNNTGGIITSLDIGYIGEQWRLGYSGRTENDRLDFQYSLDAASLSTGTWTDFDALDFVAPVSTGTVGVKNGNSIEFRTALSSTITGLTIPVGTTFWIRWKDFNAYSSDDGLAVDDLTLTANGYIPVVDPAPTVSSTIPGNGAVNIPINQNISLTFSEDVNVTGDWFDLSCSTSGDHTAIVSGGPTTFVLNPSTDLAFAETCTLTIYAAQVADADTNDPPDNMAADQSFSFTTMDDVCSLSYTPAFSIQGSGLTSPMSGTTVTTQGVVVGDYEGPGYGGFYLQEMTGDGDPATSDAIFIYHGYTLNTVNVGDVVRVTGKVSEYYSQTQVSATSPTSVVYCGTGTVAPTDVTLPFTSATQPEQYEGMLVRLPQTMYVTEHYELGRYGDVLVSANGRLQQPTNVEEPGEAALALQAANDLNQIVIEDAKTGQNADPIVLAREGLPLSASNTLRGGDTATGIVGVLNYTYSKYRVRPMYALGGYVNFEPTNLRPEAAPELAEGSRLRVAGMNLLNFFNTFTGCTEGVDGVPTDCRGAENQVEYDRQLPKTVAAIIGTNADVIGLVELENDGYGPDSAIQALVDALNVATAPDTYAFIDVDAGTGQINALGLDAIKVGMIYRTASVIPVGTTAALNSVEFVNGGDSDIRNRPALAQAFQEISSGARFVATVNHLKSKGSACDSPDALDGQGNCNIVRTYAATLLTEWLASDPTGINDPDAIILGDLNSYAMEDPITAIKAAGFINLIDYMAGSDAYSYVFDGQWGYLDHALATENLTGQVRGVADWHINADEPSVLDYNTNYKTENLIATLYAPDEFRIADHDPVLVDLELDNVPPTLGELTVIPDLLKINTAVTASASFTDPGIFDTHTAWIDWGDGATTEAAVSETNGSGTATGTHNYTTPGVYRVMMVVYDNYDAASNESIYEYVVVYDPEAGFVTGGGWIDTPAGAYTADPALEEKAKFEFAVRFKHGKKVQMDGDFLFQFDQTPFMLTSTSIDWLVIDQAAMTAQFKGQGMLNGSGNYHFWVWVTDGETDTFRVKIWEENGDLLYDTFIELPLGGGSVIIHE